VSLNIENVTLKDVATRAGVSTATVSHVLNNTRFVSDSLRETVLKAVGETGYFRNELARGLRRGATATIGLMIPDNSNPFFAELARIIEDWGFSNGYSVILCNSAGNLDREAAYINTLISKQIDGVIFIASHSNDTHLMEFKKRKIPIILVDRDLPLILGDTILIDNDSGGYTATKYLIELGHKKIACITGPSDVTPSADRVKGYYRALQEAGIKRRDDYVITGDFEFQSGERAMKKLLSLEDVPTALFACNDLMAIGALRRARSENISVPVDMSIFGFDDIQFASIVSPSLSTIAQPINEIATTAIAMLIDKIQNRAVEAEGKRIVLDTHLIIRDSCCPPK
jgi:LacI family transcriptional regulator